MHRIERNAVFVGYDLPEIRVEFDGRYVHGNWAARSFDFAHDSDTYDGEIYGIFHEIDDLLKRISGAFDFLVWWPLIIRTVRMLEEYDVRSVTIATR